MTKRTLILMRHAKSSWDNDDADIDRPLSGRGRRDARAAGSALVELGLTPDVVLLSPAARATQTWDGVRDGGVTCEDVRTLGDLYDHDADTILAAIRQTGSAASTVLAIGHSPTLLEAVCQAAQRENTKQWFALDTKFPTAAIAVIEFDGDWADARPGTLTAFVVPRG